MRDVGVTLPRPSERLMQRRRACRNLPALTVRYPMSYRDIEELLLERGLKVDHSTVNRWVLAYAPLLERRLRPFRKPHCGSVRVDETYVRIRSEWRYLYCATDKLGEAVDFLLTAKRDLDAAKRFFRKMLKDGPLVSPDRIGTDGAGRDQAEPSCKNPHLPST